MATSASNSGLAGRRPGGRDLVDRLEDPLPDTLGRDAEIGEDLGAFALALRQDAEQQMLGSDLAAQPHQRLPPRRDYRPAGPWREPVQRPIQQVKAGQARHESLLGRLLGHPHRLADSAARRAEPAGPVDEMADQLISQLAKPL